MRYIHIALLAIVLTSCSEYQKVLNKGTATEQYLLATKMYEAKKFSKALNLFEKAETEYRNKPQMERIHFMKAQSLFNTEEYVLAGYFFDTFTKAYPSSSKREEAAFLSAYSYLLDSPVYSLDQSGTHKAITAFQDFMNEYPDSNRLEEANKYYMQLQLKLEKKAFEIAKGYYITAEAYPRNYRAAIVAFDNLLNDYVGTEYREETYYYSFKAAHDLALKSSLRKKEERIERAIEFGERLKKSFPKSKFLKETEELVGKLKEQQQLLVSR